MAVLGWPDVETRRGNVLVVPLGATEQHGPHLPLTTDSDIAEGLAERLGRRRAEVLVAPALQYGSSGEHQDFAGTLSIAGEATELVIVELCRSATETFGRVLLLCCHGGNAQPVRRAVRRLRGEGRDVRAWWPGWADGHAGRSETALMLALAPDRVRLARSEAGCLQPLAEILPALRAHGVRHVSPNGVLGDPTGASPEEGHALLEAALADLDQLLAGWLPA